MSTETNFAAVTTSQSNPASRLPASPQRSGFGGQNRPPRRKLASSKAPVMSAEARRQLEAANRALIDEALQQGRVTVYTAKWADGARERSDFGGSEA